MKGSADSQNSTWVQMQEKNQKMSLQNSKKVLEQIFPSELQEQHSTAAADNRKEKQQQNWISDSPNWQRNANSQQQL